MQIVITGFIAEMSFVRGCCFWMQIAVTGFIAGTLFLRTHLHPRNAAEALLYQGALFYTLLVRSNCDNSMSAMYVQLMLLISVGISVIARLLKYSLDIRLHLQQRREIHTSLALRHDCPCEEEAFRSRKAWTGSHCRCVLPSRVSKAKQRHQLVHP